MTEHRFLTPMAAPLFGQDGYNDRVKDAWDQNTEKLFDERYRVYRCLPEPELSVNRGRHLSRLQVVL